MRFACLLFCLVAIVSGRALANPAPAERIADGVKSVLVSENSKTDGILTVRENNLFANAWARIF